MGNYQTWSEADKSMILVDKSNSYPKGDGKVLSLNK